MAAADLEVGATGDEASAAGPRACGEVAAHNAARGGGAPRFWQQAAQLKCEASKKRIRDAVHSSSSSQVHKAALDCAAREIKLMHPFEDVIIYAAHDETIRLFSLNDKGELDAISQIPVVSCLLAAAAHGAHHRPAAGPNRARALPAPAPRVSSAAASRTLPPILPSLPRATVAGNPDLDARHPAPPSPTLPPVPPSPTRLHLAAASAARRNPPCSVATRPPTARIRLDLAPPAPDTAVPTPLAPRLLTPLPERAPPPSANSPELGARQRRPPHGRVNQPRPDPRPDPLRSTSPDPLRIDFCEV
nr:vegetative cell wall protein gp1-like [Aegilops tauschii subsp. strangulata]